MAPQITKWLAQVRRQLAAYQLPPLPFMNLKPAKGGRRAKRLQLRLGNYRLAVSLRFFKTNRQSRSKKLAQLVLPVPFLAIKEIAITKKSGPKLPKILIRGQSQLRPAVFTPIIIGLVGIAIFATHLTHAAQITAPTRPTGHVLAAHAVAPQSKTLPASTPTQLVISKIDLSAPISPVGLNADKSLSVPSDPNATGWYSGSPTPGQLGPSVIDGHLDKVGGIAIFWRLRELVPGDIIEITRADSTVARFKVDAVQQFPQDQFPTSQVYGNINYAGIRLITCGGVFNTDTHHYSDNFVVFGSLQ